MNRKLKSFCAAEKVTRTNVTSYVKVSALSHLASVAFRSAKLLGKSGVYDPLIYVRNGESLNEHKGFMTLCVSE